MTDFYSIGGKTEVEGRTIIETGEWALDWNSTLSGLRELDADEIAQYERVLNREANIYKLVFVDTLVNAIGKANA